MLDFFHSISPVYDKFRSQMTQEESCENIVRLAKTGSKYRVMILLNKNGEPVHSSVIEPDDSVMLYSISSKNNVFRLRGSSVRDEENENTNVLDALKEEDDKELFKVSTGLVSSIDDLINIFEKTPQKLPAAHPVRHLRDRLAIAVENPRSFLETMFGLAKKCVEEYVQNSKKNVAVKAFGAAGIDIVFDIDDKNDVQSSMTDLANRKKSDSTAKGKGSFTDMFGNVGEISEEKFGKIHNWFPLYQKDEDVGAFASYGLNSVSACPVSSESRSKIHNIASWVISQENKGKLWNRRFSGKTTAIIIVVPNLEETSKIVEMEKSCFHILADEDFFSDIENSKTGNETYSKETSLFSYRERSKAAVQSLTGIIESEPFAKFSGRIISKFGDCAYGVTDHLEFTAHNLKEAIIRWQKANDEAVSRKIIRFSKGKAIGYYGNRYINTFDIPNVMNIHWTLGTGIDGQRKFIPKYVDKITIESFTHADAISLFLKGDIVVANRIIKEFVNHQSFLLYDVARRNNRGDNPCLFEKTNRMDVLKIPSIVNIAFLVKGISMESRENNMGYNLGRMLGLADWLHVARCHAKEDRLPSELIGSRFISSFAGRARLANSITNFQRDFRFIADWAKQVSYSKSIKNVDAETVESIIAKFNWFINCSNKIGSDIPNRLSTDDAAHFALGYYSIYPFSSRKATEEVK